MRRYLQFGVGMVLLMALAAPGMSQGNYNVSSTVDLSTLTRENFEATLLPVAQQQGSLTVYNFDTFFEPMLAEINRRFTERYGIGVTVVTVDSDTAVQQLIAERQAGAPSAADVFLFASDSIRAALSGGVVAQIPLLDILPNAINLDPNVAGFTRGVRNNGWAVPFHRNQAALAYLSDQVSDPPDTLQELRDFACANPGKVALTNPYEGGSGATFLEAVALELAGPREDYYNFDLTEEQAGDLVDSRWQAVYEYFRSLLACGTFFTNSNVESEQVLATGAALVATVWEDCTFTFVLNGTVPPTVRLTMLASGHPGGGDDVMVVAGTQKVEAALLYVNFLMSQEVQLYKLQEYASRSARQDLDTSMIGAERRDALVPQEQYVTRSVPRINSLIREVAEDSFAAEVLSQAR
ncbi:MAG: extracellular solute-binding protein [Deinococcus sp.]|nr:extracellular solute-binding protein [Deinococcus sp.]